MAEDISEESDYVIGKLYQFANKAISALARKLIEGREDHRGEASVINVELAKSDWKKLNRKITELINEAAPQGRNRPRRRKSKPYLFDHELL